MTKKAKEDAPNYRGSEFEDKFCTNCKFNEEGHCTLFEFDFDQGFICDAWEPIPIEEKALQLERPHGFLLWRGKKKAVASDGPLPVGEVLTVVSGGEAYGRVSLSAPAQMALSYFDQEKQFDQHCVRPSERRLWWPDAEMLYLHRVEKWEPFEKSVLADVKDGRVVFRQPDRLSREEKELIGISKTLPKMINLEGLTISVSTKDPTQISAPANLPWELKSALSRVLKSTFQRQANYVDKAQADHLPIYEVSLVRSPRMEIRRFGGDDQIDTESKPDQKAPPWRILERDGKQCVIKIEDGSVVQCYEGTGAHERAMKLLAALNINVEERGSEHHEEEEDHDKRQDEEEEEDGHDKEYDEAELAIEDEKRRWTRKFINDLPDSHFLYVESGGELDAERKTTPRRLRHFPFKDSTGKIDLPHLRNAIARIPQSRDKDGNKLSRSLVERLQREAREILEKENEKSGKSMGVEEGEKVGRRLRKSWIDRLKDFGGLIKELLHWADYQDIDTDKAFGTPSGFALKEINGETWYFTWSTNAFEDRQGEIFSTKSLEQYVDEASQKQDRGYFNFWHIAGTDFARKEWQAVIGRFLVEAGPFMDNHAGRSAKKYFMQYPEGHPDFAPEGWGASPEFRYLPEEREKGIYNWIWITRTTTLPRAAAANIRTKAGQEVHMALEGQQKDAAIDLFGEDFVQRLIKDGEKRTEDLENSGVAHKQAGQDTKQAEQFVAALQKLADGLEDGAIKEQILSTADGLTDDNMAERGEDLQTLSEQLEDEELQAQLADIAEQMQKETEEEETAAAEEAPATDESKETPSFTIDQIVSALSAKMETDFAPFAEALASVAVDIKTIGDRVQKLENAEAFKENTDIPRFMLSLKRASEAGETAIEKGDPLQKQKPKEQQVEGSYASAFFGK